MTPPEDYQNDLISLFGSQPLAVLATHNRGQPYGSLVAFAATVEAVYGRKRPIPWRPVRL